MIPHKTVEEILSTARVEEVIEDFVTLRRRGSNMMGLCPFHDEKSPSFVVSPAKGIYKCFGCSKSGTAVGFIMEHENISYPEALRYLANRYNITVEEAEITPEEREAKQVSDSLYIINDYAAQHFANNLVNTEDGKAIGLSYFKERGFNTATIKEWQLGYAMGDGKTFTKEALDKQFKLEYLKILGLTTQQYEGDFFRGRVMFAIHNLGGKIIAFAGRVLGKTNEQPKYINSPESEIYLKRKVLFGLYHAKNEVRKVDECYLVEGYTDVITLHQGGVKNVVASSGTSLTVEQVSLIKRFTDNLTILYDGDKAGVKAALRGLDIALKQDMNVRLVLLPDGEDPDSFYKSRGLEQFTAYIQQEKKDFIRFKTDLLLEESGSDPIKRSAVLRDIVNSVAVIPDPIKRRFYIQELSVKFAIEEQTLLGEIDQAVSKNKQDKYKEYERNAIRDKRRNETTDIVFNEATEQIEFKPIQVNTDFAYEYNLVRLLVNGCNVLTDPDGTSTVSDMVLPVVAEFIDLVVDEKCKSVFMFAINKYNESKELIPNDFIHHDDTVIRSMAVDVSMFEYTYAKWENKGIFLQTQPVPEKNYDRDTKQSIMRFKQFKIGKEIDTLQSHITSGKLSPEDLQVELQVLMKLTQERNELAKHLTRIVL